MQGFFYVEGYRRLGGSKLEKIGTCFSGISHLRALTRMRDPIHAVIELNLFDREFIDSPYFQRLHNILQNSTTYAAYPSNKTSRFVHSIGVAHLAGNMFVSAINFGRSKDVEEFLRSIRGVIEKEFIPKDKLSESTDRIDQLIDGWKKTIAHRSGFKHSPFVQDNPEECLDANHDFKNLPAEFLVDTIWQSLRICGLAHDVGHLPMSHTMESAVQSNVGRIFEFFDKIKIPSSVNHSTLQVVFSSAKNNNQLDGSNTKHSKKILEGFIDPEKANEFATQFKGVCARLPIHEQRSLFILGKIYDETASKFDPRNSNVEMYYKLIYWFAFFILYSSVLKQAKIDSLHKFINDTNLLACLRVLKTIIAGEIDADRLDYTLRDGWACGSTIGNFEVERIVNNLMLVKRDDHFHVAVYERGISGVEQFFSERRDCYKYLIYHRTSSRSESCLQEALARLFHICVLYPNHRLTEIFSKHDFVQIAAGKVTEVLPLTKKAIVAQDDAMLRVMLHEVLDFLETHSIEDDEIPSQLLAPLQMLLRIFLFRDFSSIVSPLKKTGIKKFLISDLNKTERKQINAVKKAAVDSFDEYAGKLRLDFWRKFPGVIALATLQSAKTFKAKDFSSDDAGIIYEYDHELVNLVDKSSTLYNMTSEADSLTKIRVYFIADKIKENNDLIDKLNLFLKECMLNYYRDVLKRIEIEPEKEAIKCA